MEMLFFSQIIVNLRMLNAKLLMPGKISNVKATIIIIFKRPVAN